MTKKSTLTHNILSLHKLNVVKPHYVLPKFIQNKALNYSKTLKTKKVINNYPLIGKLPRYNGKSTSSITDEFDL